LLRLHAAQWQGRGGNPEHQTDRFREHLTEALGRMVADGQAVLSEYRLAGETLAGQVHLVGHQTLFGYILGASPQLRKLIYVAALLVPHGVELARERGLPHYSLLRGLEEYKRRWHPETVVQERVLLHRPGLMGGCGYPLMVEARARLAVLVRKKRARTR
jgi:CelD/BcsL family acetyltransferase involved in cellulose biosynthesis